MKKIMVFLIFLLALFALSGTAVMAEGTVSDTPFQISSAAEFNVFAQAVNESSTNTFTIGTGEGAVTYTDAELTNSITFDIGTPLIPAGVYASAEDTSQNHPFTGTFEGNDLTITAYYNDETADYVGVFGYLKDATIQNLTVDGTITGHSYVGGIVGYNQGTGTITGCSVTDSASVSGTVNYVGGIAGFNSATIENCTVSAPVSGTGTYSQSVGGIAGYNYGTGTITGCSVTDSASVSGEETVGGIVGWNKGTIENCTISAPVSSTGTSGGAFGGIAGDNYYNGTITGCSVSASVSASVSGPTEIGGIAGVNAGTIGGSDSGDSCTVSAPVSGTGDYVGGITGSNQTDAIITGCSVTDSASVSGSSYVAGIASLNAGIIENCIVSAPVSGSSYVAGIACLNDIGSNTNISNCSVSASISGSSYVAGIASDNKSAITNSYFLKYTATLNGTASGTSYDGSGTSVQFSSGEIAWKLQNPEKVDSAYAAQSGLVWGQTLPGASGSVPELTTDSAKQVYQLSFTRADGSSSATPDPVYLNPGQSCEDADFPAADTGYTWVDTEGNPYESSYTMPDLADTPGPADMVLKESTVPTGISVATDAHAVVNDQETIRIILTNTTSTNIYRCKVANGAWSSATTIAAGSDGYFDVTLSASNPTIYIQQEIDTDSWSLSYSQTLSDIYCLTTVTDPDDATNRLIQIASADDFNAFATYINSGWNTTSGIIDAEVTDSFELTDSFTQITAYSGSFSGLADLVTDSPIIAMTNCTKSLFATNNGTLQNLTINAHISSTSSVSAIANKNNKTIKDCTISGSITTTDSFVAGITTDNNGTISGCTVLAAVSSPGSQIAGIAATNNNGSISDCLVSGEISCTNVNLSESADSCGGIAADNYASIAGCSVTGQVSGNDNTGGIAGTNGDGSITGCSVTGQVSGYTNTGGITGTNDATIGGLDDSLACTVTVTATVSGEKYTGGIAGKNTKTIAGCTVSGSVLATEEGVGGIAGVNEGTISACSAASVSGSKNYIGGIAGQNEGDISVCSVTTAVATSASDAADSQYIGGIAGSNDGNLSNCSVPGSVSGTGDTVGGIAGSNTASIINVYYLNDLSGLSGIGGTESDDSGINATTTAQFADGSVAYALRKYQDANYTIDDTSLVWGQLLTASASESAEPYPILSHEAGKQVYQLLFYDTDGTSLLNTSYANNGGTTVNFPDPGSGYNWMNGSAQFTAASLVTSDLKLIKTTVSSPGGGGGGSSTPTMTDIVVPAVTTTPDGTPNIDITGLPDGATVYYSTDGVTYTTTPPSFEEAGTYTLYIKITASGYQTYTTTTTVTVSESLPDEPIIISPFSDGSSTRPASMSNGGFGIAYSFDLAGYLSGDSATDASVSSLDLADTLSTCSFSGFSIDNLDDPYGLLADGDNAPAISDTGVFSCYLNYAAASPNGQTAMGTAAKMKTLNETADTASTESSSNSDKPTASADSTLDAADDSSDTVMLSATLIINVTLASGEIAPVTLDIEVPQRLYNIDYRTHIQNIGWEDTFVEDGELSGTEGQSLRLEAIEIQMDTGYDLGVSYRTHVQNLGWEENYVSDGAESGTDGQGLRLEAIELSLTGADADYFDIYYQVHVQNLGWLDWASNGDPAGSAGFGYRLEGIRIVVVPKGADAPGATDKSFVEQ